MGAVKPAHHFQSLSVLSEGPVSVVHLHVVSWDPDIKIAESLQKNQAGLPYCTIFVVIKTRQFQCVGS